MKIKNWNIEELAGYKPITTFYQDFSIADNFGIDAVKDTYKRAFDEWKDDYKYLTELVLVLNWKIWEHYEINREYTKIYNEFWEKTQDFAFENLKGEKLEYFVRTID